MRFFDFFKRKTAAEKNSIRLNKIRAKTIVSEKRSLMHDMIVSSSHDDSLLDENPNGEGPFGLSK